MPEPSARHDGKPCCGSKQHRHKKSCPEDTFGPDASHTGEFDGEETPTSKKCCGSRGSRHMKNCDLAGTELHGQSPNRRTVDNRKPFSEPTYNIIKDMLGEGRDVDGISAEKGLDLNEIRRINLSDDFEDYLTIA